MWAFTKKNHEKNWRVSLCVRKLFHPKDFSAFFQPLWDFRSQRTALDLRRQTTDFQVLSWFPLYLFLDFWLAWVTTGDSSLSSTTSILRQINLKIWWSNYEWKLPSWTEHEFSMCPRILRTRIHRLPFPSGPSRTKHLWWIIALANKRRHGARASSKCACEYWQNHQVRTLMQMYMLWGWLVCKAAWAMQHTCTVLSQSFRTKATQDHKCTSQSVLTLQGHGRHTTSAWAKDPSKKSARELDWSTNAFIFNMYCVTDVSHP